MATQATAPWTSQPPGRALSQRAGGCVGGAQCQACGEQAGAGAAPGQDPCWPPRAHTPFPLSPPEAAVSGPRRPHPDVLLLADGEVRVQVHGLRRPVRGRRVPGDLQGTEGAACCPHCEPAPTPPDTRSTSPRSGQAAGCWPPPPPPPTSRAARPHPSRMAPGAGSSSRRTCS